MKKAKKGLIIAAIVLFLTVGVFVLRNYVFSPPAGLNVPSSFDILLALPAIPFILLFLALPKMSVVITFTSVSILTVIFWLYVGYKIGAHLDKKSKK